MVGNRKRPEIIDAPTLLGSKMVVFGVFCDPRPTDRFRTVLANRGDAVQLVTPAADGA
jgi:hypothetical protein